MTKLNVCSRITRIDISRTDMWQMNHKWSSKSVPMFDHPEVHLMAAGSSFASSYLLHILSVVCLLCPSNMSTYDSYQVKLTHSNHERFQLFCLWVRDSDTTTVSLSIQQAAMSLGCEMCDWNKTVPFNECVALCLGIAAPTPRKMSALVHKVLLFATLMRLYLSV